MAEEDVPGDMMNQDGMEKRDGHKTQYTYNDDRSAAL